MEDLHKNEYKILVQQLFDESITLLNNEHEILPLIAANLANKKSSNACPRAV